MKRKIINLTLIACLAGLPLSALAKSNSSHLNKLRTQVGRSMVEATADTWEWVIPYYTPDVEYSDPVVKIEGIEMMYQFLFQFFASSPDLITTVEDEICIDGMYTATWTMVGNFGEVPYEAKGVTVIKFLDKSAQVYYQKDYYSEGDIMTAIPGLNEAIAGFRVYYRCSVEPGYDCPLPPPPPQE